MSDMREELRAWIESQALRPDETQTEHDMRRAFDAFRFLVKHRQRILFPWRGFNTPEEREASLHHPVLVKNARGDVTIAVLNEFDGQGVVQWMDIP